MKAKLLSLALLATLGFAACKKESKPEPQITKATITLKNASGAAASGITVYAYDQDTWKVMGDDPFFADGEVTSDANGIAEFTNLEYPTTFNEINKNQNNFRFSAHYAINGVNKAEVASITIQKGDHARLTLTLK